MKLIKLFGLVLCHWLYRINEVFFWGGEGERALPTSRNISEIGKCTFKACIVWKLWIFKKNVFIIWVLYLLKRYRPSLQNDTKLEKTYCLISEKMAFDERSFCTGSLWKAYWWCDSNSPEKWLHNRIYYPSNRSKQI